MRRGWLGLEGREAAVFVEEAGRIWLERLFGIACSNCGEDTGPISTQGLAVLSTSLGIFEGPDLAARECIFDGTSARIEWLVAGGALRLDSRWTLSPAGIVSRRDVLVNASMSPVTVYKCHARFSFPPGRYEVLAQASSWSRENQPFRTELRAGVLELRCEGGRTTQGGTPYACIREAQSARGVAFHVVPKGDWAIRFSARSSFDGLPYAVVEPGLASDDLRLVLSPGEAFELPEILVQGFDGPGERAACALHRHALSSLVSRWSEPPIVYNTWFDRFDDLDPERLGRQLRAARELGCETFVVDAGWYGAGGPWWRQVGDWRERLDGAFRGGMAAFAEEVRAAGLGFGLWMEPERFFEGVPVLREHPDWFVRGSRDAWRIRMEREDARAWLRAEIERLLETYRLAWMKIDFNFELGRDESGAELARYYEAWYAVLDGLRRSHPETFFEGCSSGGMRLELGSLGHFDAHFLSDTVNPVDVIRIAEGALLRVPPGWLARWAVLYPLPAGTAQTGAGSFQVLAPCRAGRERLDSVDVDFAACAALPGVFGLSGDIAGLAPEVRARLAEHVAFYKRWRGKLRGAVAHLLTPQRPRDDRQGWSAVELLHEESGTAFLFAYRLDDARERARFRLEGLVPAGRYSVERHPGPPLPLEELSGEELAERGLEVRLPERFRACVAVLSPASGPISGLPAGSV